jgi:hypothetical protein
VNRRREAHYEPTIEDLRERAAYYRAQASKTRNPVKAATYRDIADIIEREADAQQAEEATQRVNGFSKRCGAILVVSPHC